MSSSPETLPHLQPTVSVCIPTYNQGRYIGEAIESVLAQSYPVSEIVVSDDGSTDETQAICEEYARKIPHFRYHRQPQNRGIGANIEFVLRQAKSTYVARLDSDDRLLPDYLSRMVEVLEKFPDAGYAHGDAWEIDGEGRRLQTRTLFRDSGFQPERPALIGSVKGYRVAANIVIFRATALATAFPGNGLPDFVEDYYISVAMARDGYGNVYVGELLAEYRVWADQKGVRARRLEQNLRGLIRVFSEQIEPGFRGAGVSLTFVRRARKLWAIRGASSLDNIGWTAEEKERLKASLIELGDCNGLRLVIFLSKMRLGFLSRSYWQGVDFVRNTAKRYRSSLVRKSGAATLPA